MQNLKKLKKKKGLCDIIERFDMKVKNRAQN